MFLSATTITSPPLPPSPPSGPPRSTYFSRRNETHPFPPSPALTRILTLSTNMSVRVHEELLYAKPCAGSDKSLKDDSLSAPLRMMIILNYFHQQKSSHNEKPYYAEDGTHHC